MGKRQKWTDPEVVHLKHLFEEGKTDKQIARILCRFPNSIATKRKALKLSRYCGGSKYTSARIKVELMEQVKSSAERRNLSFTKMLEKFLLAGMREDA